MSPRKILPFYMRFNIPIDVSTAHKRFFARVKNIIIKNFFEAELDHDILDGRIKWQIANILGITYGRLDDIEHYIIKDFHHCLHALEIAYQALTNKKHKDKLEYLIKHVLSLSEIDFGIAWKKGYFIRKGAALLDNALINEPLEWLMSPKYISVYTPFTKGLSHLLDAEKKPVLLSDVVTDMYESIEALAKMVTGKPRRDLSGNAELFIKSVNATESYKRLLREYIAYANLFRHAVSDSAMRPKISIKEAESFVYMTGIFIRLAMI